MKDLKFDETTFKLIKITQDKDLAVAVLSRKIEGFDTSTKLLYRIIDRLYQIIYQVSYAGSNVDSYEIKLDKLVTESNLNQLLYE